MPYGLPKEIDTPANNKKIEMCVAEMTKKGKDETSAIKICKSSIMDAHMKKHSDNFAEWDTKYMNDLPDSSFAYISAGGKKDGSGKTVPRSLRHLPYKDASGKPDLPHVRNALARLNQTDIPDGVKSGIKSKLEAILSKSKGSEITFYQEKNDEAHIQAILPFEFDDTNDAGANNAMPNPSMVHLIPIGEWVHDAYGPIIINASDIREYAQNFNAGLRKGVFITAGHEGMQELPAAGWVAQVEPRDNGLWGMVEWTDLGKEYLSDKQFKYFSPEMYREYEDPETHQVYSNVLTGGALTKSPYFKELQAIVFSDKNIKNNFDNQDNNMTKTLEEVLALDVATLTDEDKAVLKENEATLTDEQKAKYFPTTETAEEKEAREKKEQEDKNIADGKNADGTEKISGSEKVMITASELALLRKHADEGAEANKKLLASEMTATIKEMVFTEVNKDGKFLPKSEPTLRSFMAKLNEAQKAEFKELVKQLPNKQLFGEIGSAKGGEGTVQAEVEAKVNAKVEAAEKAGKKMKYSDALKEVMSENKGLEERYDAELPSVRGKKE